MTKQKFKEFLNPQDWEKFRKEYESSDDRSCALLCAAYLENCLEILILDTLLHKDEAYQGLFRDIAPLGTFNAKTKIAFCLNLLPEIVYKDLNTIRDIRNKFAHKLHGLSFSVDPILSLCNKLLTPDDFLNEYSGRIYKKAYPKDPRAKFIFTSAIITSTMEGYYHQRAEKIHQTLLEIEPFE